MIFFVKSKEKSYCPFCSSSLAIRDSKNRKALKDDGVKRIYRLRRLKCSACDTLHTELPDFMLPFKHYEASVIEEALEGPNGHCPADNSTMNRWRSWFERNRTLIESSLSSLCTQLHGSHVPLNESFSLLDSLNLIRSGCLKHAVKLLINSGLWSHTQFASTP